ncbi:BTB/POZ domain-containing protein [Chlorella vulgaris]
MPQASSGVWSSGNVLVVPPLEAVWLTGSELQLQEGRGCLSFEVKADNDATVLLKQQSGSRRWQHLTAKGGGRGAAAAVDGQQAPAQGSPVEQNYTVILGSHRNSCLKFEKDGELCCMVPTSPEARLSATCFSKYWINYNAGCISVGAGEPGEGLCYSWTDPEPIPSIRFAGLSAWDKHVGYRNLRMHPALAQLPPSPALEQHHIEGPSAHQQPQQGLPGDAPPAQHGKAPPSLLECCQAALLRSFSPSGVCDLLQVADCLSPVADGLRSQAIEFAAAQLSAVVTEDLLGFCSLSTATLEEILCSQSLDCAEKCVFDAVMKWAGYGCEVADASSAGHPMQAQLAQRGAISMQDKRHVRALTASERLASSRFQLRRAPGCTELLYLYDGDRNGVCWHLGTACGTQPWVNPVLAGRLAVRASSPACRSTDPKALAGHGFARCNFAGPRMEGGQLSSWWVLDLGAGHRLICNHYTLRHDGSTDFLRSWVLQGSNDGSSWSDLRRHISDRTIRMPGQYASWPLSSHAAAVPYRFFRLLLVGPNPEAANQHHVCLSFWELYGFLYNSKQQQTAATDDAPTSAA